MLQKEYDQTKEFWANEVIRGGLIWPDESVIRFVKKNCKQGETILDYGCGMGRNAIALVKEGYNVIAMDYNKEGIEQMLARESSIQAIQNSTFDVPLPPESVDAIVACGSLFYYNRTDLLKIMCKLKESLKTGGKIWANWRAESDDLIKHGTLIGDGLYVLDGQSGRCDTTYFFASEEQLRDIYEEAGFEIKTIDDYSFTENNRQKTNHWYHIVAERNNG